MDPKIKEDLKTIQSTINNAYASCGRIMAKLDGRGAGHAGIASDLDKMSGQFESGAITLRNLCEKHRPNDSRESNKPTLPAIRLTGRAEVNEYGWLHIELNALLPHCRFQTPVWLTNTIRRLLDDYENTGKRLPFFDCAMLAIDEHCDIDSRRIYDSDNKGYKAIPNALKGRLIKDDDQFSLGITLVSTRSEKPACHIYLLPQDEAGDFFSMKYGDYPMFSR